MAVALGVSVSVVSRALKNSPRVSLTMRERVQTAAREMHYQPNAMAAGLAHFKQTSKIKPVQAALAWLNVWPKPNELRNFLEFDRYWQGASQAAEKFGYRLEEFHVTDQLSLRRLEKVLLARSVPGILLPPARSVLDWTGFAWKHFSTVRLDRATPGLPPFHTVTSAQFANAILAFNKIGEKGYHRIGFVGHRTMGWSFLGGFLHAQEANLPKSKHLPPMLFEKDPLTARPPEIADMNEVYPRFVAWLDKWKPDAILTESPEVMPFLKKAGRRVPDDIGVAGLSVLDTPFDTGIYQNPEEIGRVSMLVILSLINDNDHGIPPLPREILVKGDWVNGSSLLTRG